MQGSNAMVLGAALAAALALPSAAIAGTVRFSASLAGAEETGGGASGGSGNFAVEIDPDAGDFCYQLKFKGIGAATAAHVHAGAAGTDGPPVVTLSVAGGDVDECLAIEPDKLKPIVDEPANFYVNVHTAAFPKGAIRGQLTR